MSQQTPSDNSTPVMPLLVFFGGIVLILLAVFANRPATTTVTPTPVVIVAATTAPQTVASSGLDAAGVKSGEAIFQSVCAACHGFNALGIPGLGKPLIGSQFVNSLTDDELLTFLNVGRPVTDPLNTTGVMMPAKGGNPTFKDDDLRNVIAFIRSLNGVEVAPLSAEQIAAAAAQPTLPPAEFNAGAISSLLGTSSNSTADSTSTVEATPVPAINTFNTPGATDYVSACAGCHGLRGEGQAYLTKPLSDSEMFKTVNTIGILNMFTTAHPPTIEFQHPYRGGYPELSDNQLLGIITYLITLPK